MTIYYYKCCNRNQEDITMNIFVLSYDPEQAAKYQCDKHVVKMCLESTQLLCTVVHLLGKNVDGLYKKTHVNHPCTVVIKDSVQLRSWLIDHTFHLFKEYTYRYGKVHKSQEVFMRAVKQLFYTKNYNKHTLPFAKVTNNDLDNVVLSYRKYYRSKYLEMDMKWTNRKMPQFMLEVGDEDRYKINSK